MSRIEIVKKVAFAMLLTVAPMRGAGADVAILKSGETVAAPLLEKLRQGLSAHSVTEYDVHNDPAQARRVVASLKGRSVVFVALGPVSASAVREAAPQERLAYALVPEAARAGLIGIPQVAGVACVIYFQPRPQGSQRLSRLP